MLPSTVDPQRLNLPFVGHITFAKSPACADWDHIDADIAVLGVPTDMATQNRPGTRFGPRAIRIASATFAYGHNGTYSHEDDRVYLSADQARMVDLGDVDIVHTNPAVGYANTEAAVRRILSAGAMPVVLGGDHSISVPVVRALDQEGPLHVIQIDAHLDFVNERFGVRYGNGNPFRRISEMDHVTGLSQIGIRNVSASSAQDYADARAAGSDILSVRQFRDLGVNGVLARIPAGRRYYVSIDIDCFDPSIAPGTGTPSNGGFTYYEVLDLLRGLAQWGHVAGMDLVEVAPAYDPAELTAMLAAQVLTTGLGYIFYERSRRAAKRFSSFAIR